MDLEKVAAGLATSPTAWMLALALAALAYLYKQLADSHKDQIALIKEAEAARRDTFEKLLPLTQQLATAMTVVDKIISKGT